VIKKINIFVLLFLFFITLLGNAAKEPLEPLRPFKTDASPVIDGILDDIVWQKASHVTGFKTWYPDIGKEMAEKTIVYLAYDQENLYFAFRCFDSQPDKIKASVSSRDNMTPDDWVCINLDSFNDQQSLYTFYTNPLGIQGDARYEGGQEDPNVDMVWYSGGNIDDEGYTVEVRIPFKSIRFSNKNPVEMAVIFERKISRLSEMGTYPPLDPKKGTNWLIQTTPISYQDIKHYKLFELLPAITYSRRSSVNEGTLSLDKDKGDLSLTAKYGITSHLILDGTINPDFSQVEADAGQVDFNLRYALFFPEKRPFFLEGYEKFNFGGYHDGDPIWAIVHTRTIVDPLVGIKLNGKIGNDNTVASIYTMDNLYDAEEDHAHFAIFRYKRALAEDSFIGGFYTGRERTNGYNRVVGADGQLRIGQASIFGFHFFESVTKADKESSNDDGHALGLHYFYNTRDWLLMLGFQDIADDFRTETGYVTRTGITRFRSGAIRMLYPDSKIIMRVDPIIHSYQIRDKLSGLYETMNSFDLRLILPRNSYVLFGYCYATEVFLDEKFDISGPRFIASSQFTRQFFFSLSYYRRNKIRYIADPYQGYGSDTTATFRYLPSEKLHLDLSLTYSDFYREFDSLREYDYTIIRNRTTYQVNKYLFFRGIIEYNSFHKQLLTDLLASFTYIPGTVIHVGYGSLYEKLEWIENEYRYVDDFMETQRALFFKASFLWRL
jgi:hypothetical protein